jgi:hypothetical protein
MNPDRFISYTELDGTFELATTEGFNNEDMADVILNIFDAHPEYRAGIINACTYILKPNYPANRPQGNTRPDKSGLTQ